MNYPLQVLKKRRASRLEHMKANIKRENKVAPLPIVDEHAANPDERPLSRSATYTPYQAQVPTAESSAAAEWNSMFGAI